MKLKQKEIVLSRSEENFWIRHCVKFLRRDMVPKSFSDLHSHQKTERIKKLYQFMNRWILAKGSDYQKQILVERKNLQSK